MKVFYINPMSYNNSALYDEALLAALSSSGNNIHFFGSKYYDAKPIEGIEFNPIFKYNKLANNLFKLISYTISWIGILTKALRIRPTIVHIQWGRVPYLDRLFIRGLKMLRCKIIHTAHNLIPHNADLNKSKRKYRRYYKQMNALVVHSQKTKSEMHELMRIPLEKIQIIPHGLIAIPHNESALSDLTKSLTETYKLQDKFILVSLGSQSAYKGTHALIDIWRENDFLNQHPNIHLFLVGKFDANIDYTPLSQYHNVSIINRRITDEEYIAFTRLANIILLPYKEISQSGVLLAALHEHIPVLVSHVGGLYEPLKLAPVGIDMGDFSKINLQNAITSIIQSPEPILHMKNNNKLWAAIDRFYSWEKIGALTLNLYKSI